MKNKKVWDVIPWVMVIGSLLGIASSVYTDTDYAEDSVFFNCHLHGNEVCGSVAVWHGWVNL